MTTDLNKEKERAPYQSTLRARHKEQTSRLILDSVGAIIRRADLAAVSIAEVARVADITERTVYRHYETRDDLIRAIRSLPKPIYRRSGGRYADRSTSLAARTTTS